ncbi:MAG: hydantoinase/oxoprolinase family protein, partial [Actinomycetota bacterium]|nr:hydantoinase/oxoprolinase family protein [Actinomycetota bacterium]
DGRIELDVDMRYRGQAYELTVPLPVGTGGKPDLGGAERRFHEAHRAAYGHDSPVEEVELVTLRVRAIGPVGHLSLSSGHNGSRPEPTLRRTLYSEAGPAEVDVYDRADLGEGARFDGPALVDQDDSTMLVPAGWSLEVTAAGTAILIREGR